MVVYRLHYFNAKARAEGIRWLFTLAGVPFQDVRFDIKEWEQIKPKMPFGYVPVLEVDGQYLSESQAIGRYLAGKFGYGGKSDWERALADQFVDMLYDILAGVRAVGRAADEESRAQRLKDLIEKDGPGVLRHFENQLAVNKSGYLVGDSLTWADVFVVAYLDSFIDRISPEFGEMLGKFPKVLALLDKVREIPSIAAFIAKRPNTKV